MISLINRYVRGATAAEYAANLRRVYTVHTIQVFETLLCKSKLFFWESKPDVKHELSIVLQNFCSNKTWYDWFPLTMERRFASVHGLSFFCLKTWDKHSSFFCRLVFWSSNILLLNKCKDRLSELWQRDRIHYHLPKKLCLNWLCFLQLKLKRQTCDFPKCLTKSCWILLLVTLHIKKSGSCRLIIEMKLTFTLRFDNSLLSQLIFILWTFFFNPRRVSGVCLTTFLWLPNLTSGPVITSCEERESLFGTTEMIVIF